MSWPYDIQFRYRLFWLSAKLLIGSVRDGARARQRMYRVRFTLARFGISVCACVHMVHRTMYRNRCHQTEENMKPQRDDGAFNMLFFGWWYFANDVSNLIIATFYSFGGDLSALLSPFATRTRGATTSKEKNKSERRTTWLSLANRFERNKCNGIQKRKAKARHDRCVVSRSGKLSRDSDLIVFDVLIHLCSDYSLETRAWKYPNHMFIYLGATLDDEYCNHDSCNRSIVYIRLIYDFPRLPFFYWVLVSKSRSFSCRLPLPGSFVCIVWSISIHSPVSCVQTTKSRDKHGQMLHECCILH